MVCLSNTVGVLAPSAFQLGSREHSPTGVPLSLSLVSGAPVIKTNNQEVSPSALVQRYCCCAVVTAGTLECIRLCLRHRHIWLRSLARARGHQDEDSRYVAA